MSERRAITTSVSVRYRRIDRRSDPSQSFRIGAGTVDNRREAAISTIDITQPLATTGRRALRVLQAGPLSSAGLPAATPML